MTFYEAVSFINTDMDHIVAVLPKIKTSDLFAGFNCKVFSGAIMCFSKYTLKIQGDYAFPQDLYHEYLVTTKQLEDLIENEIVHYLRLALDERMHNTADRTQTKLGFVLTPREFCWFQQQSQNVRQADPL
jgi:hypothetical protein